MNRYGIRNKQSTTERLVKKSTTTTMMVQDDSEQCDFIRNRFHNSLNLPIIPIHAEVEFYHQQQQQPQSHYRRRNRTTATINDSTRTGIPYDKKDHDGEQCASLYQNQTRTINLIKHATGSSSKNFVVTKYHLHSDSAYRKTHRHGALSCRSSDWSVSIVCVCIMIIISMLQFNFVHADEDNFVAPTSPPTIRFNVTVSTNKNSTANTTTTTTNAPTPILSDAPTIVPTNVLLVAESLYRQGFLLPVSNTQIYLNDTEIESFTSVLESYTPMLLSENITGNSAVQTNCSVVLQSGSSNTLNQIVNEIDYRCQYSSRFVDVMDVPTEFLTWMNSNLTRFTIDLQENNIDINVSLPARMQLVLSPAPSTSPTMRPTVSTLPSFLPSIFPTELKEPTSDPEFVLPTSTINPTPPVIDENPDSKNSGFSVGGIVAIVIVGGLLCLAGLYLYYRSLQKRTDYSNNYSNQQRQEQRSQRRYDYNTNITNTSSTGFTSSVSGSRRNFLPFRSNRPLDSTFAARPSAMRYNNGHSTMNDDIGAIHNPANYVISPTDSHLSNKSLLSTGDSVMAEGSGDNDYDHHNMDEDGTKNLQDEFDLYKDQNLELLRTDVEGNLSGFEGYMSAAVTNALMGDDEKKSYEMQELLWGCDANPDGTEIEASALFEVTDWLNRNESAGMERKGAFMQEILNKMVTSVRFGVIVAEDASRTIHESAAILGLQLAEDLPVTTVIISGMRKTTRATDIINVLNEFGDIDVAAVASGKRGFGIVRFRRRISVDHALQQYRAGEIVILDVSIQMKVLMPNGVLESR